MVKECTLDIGKLPLGGLSRKNEVRIADRPDMTPAVYRGHKACKNRSVLIIPPAFMPTGI